MNSGTEQFETIAAQAASAVAKEDWGAAAAAFETLVRSGHEDVEARYGLARVYEELGRFDDAIAVLTDPAIAGRDKSRRRLAKTYIEARRFEAAMPVIDELIAAWPANDKFVKWKRLCDLSIRIQRGEELVAADRLDEAEQLYAGILADYPDAGRAHLHLGQIYAQQGRWAEASNRFRAGVAVDPENAKLTAGLARALFKNGDPAAAIAVLNQADGCGSDPDCLFLLYRCHLELHGWQAVDNVATRLLAVLPADEPLRHVVSKTRNDALARADAEKVDAVAEAGQLEAAIDGYRDLVARHRQSPLAWLRLGGALAGSGRESEAETILREAMEAHPEDMDVRAALTKLVLRSPDEKVVLAYVEEAAASGTADFEALRWLARHQAERQEWSDSTETAAKAVALDPASSSARVLLLRALIQLDRFAEGLEQADALLASGEKRIEALQLKADILVRLGRVTEAIALYCQALRLSRRDPLITERVNEALRLRNRRTERDPLVTLDELPVHVDPARVEAAMQPFLGSEIDDRSWNKRHRKMWRMAVDRVATGGLTKRDRELIEQEYAVWATMGFDRYRTDRSDLAGGPWSWRGQRLFMDGAGAARVRALFFAAVLNQLKPRRVLEVGSGNGMNLLTLAGAFPDIRFTGVELTNEGVEESQRAQSDAAIRQIIHNYSPLEITDRTAIERIDFIQGDASALPFEDGAFDLVMTVLAVEQMESIRTAALSELARVSRGHVMMLEPFRDMNEDGLKGLYVVSRGYFRGAIGELPEFGLQPVWATADFPQETFLGTALVLAEKIGGRP